MFVGITQYMGFDCLSVTGALKAELSLHQLKGQSAMALRNVADSSS